MPYRLRIAIRAITPIFNDGGTRKVPERLRVPTLKGELLWWIRAMLGGYTQNLTRLHEWMDPFFGKQEAGSDLRIGLSSALPDCQYPEKPYEVSPWRDHYGFRYLAYGLEGRYYYNPGANYGIGISLTCRKQETWMATWAGLWLLSRLGGLGGRTRRGMGGCEIECLPGTVQPVGLPSLDALHGRTPDELAEELAQGLNQISAYFATWSPSTTAHAFKHSSAWTAPSATTLPEFSCFAPGSWSGWVFPLTGSWLKAADALGRTYQSFRHPVIPTASGRPKSLDFPEANRYEDTGSASASRLAVFGLPLVFAFRNGPHKGAQVGVREPADPNDHKKGSRRSSPLFLRVIRCQTGKFFALVHVFKSRFAENQAGALEWYMLKKRPSRHSLLAPCGPFQPNWAEINNFMGGLPSGSGIHV